MINLDGPLKSSKVVIVTGSRNWNNRRLIHQRLDDLKPDIVVQGGARGADHDARLWAKKNGKVCVSFYPRWASEGSGAGLVRNIEMLDAFPCATVIAFPTHDSRGTWHTVREARARHMKTEVIR